MKGILLAIFTLLVASLSAQVKIEEEIHNFSGNKVDIDSEFGSVHVETWDQNYIRITGFAKADNYDLSKYYTLDIDRDRGGVHIDSEPNFPKGHKECKNVEIELNILVPMGLKINVDSEFGDIVVAGEYENINIDSEFGEVEIISENSNAKMNIDCEFGAVDIAVDESADLLFDIDKEFGDIKTDLPLVIKSSKKSAWIDTEESKYELNDGRVKVKIDSEFGNIYLRKL